MIDQLLDGDGREARIDGLAWKRGPVETEPGKYRQAQFKLLCLQQLVDHRCGERLAHAREPKRTIGLRDRVVRLGPGVAAREQELALAGNGKRARAYRCSNRCIAASRPSSSSTRVPVIVHRRDGAARTERGSSRYGTAASMRRVRRRVAG